MPRHSKFMPANVSIIKTMTFKIIVTPLKEIPKYIGCTLPELPLRKS